MHESSSKGGDRSSDKNGGKSGSGEDEPSEEEEGDGKEDSGESNEGGKATILECRVYWVLKLCVKSGTKLVEQHVRDVMRDSLEDTLPSIWYYVSLYQD